MNISLGDLRPRIDSTAWVAPGAVLAGDVTIEEQVSIWFGTVIRADGDTVSIGKRSNIQDGTIVHADPDFPVTVAPEVTVGHGVILHGCSIGEGSLVGMRSVVLNGASIGQRCLVAAGAVVLEGSSFEDNSLIAGAPAKRRREVTDDERTALGQNVDNYSMLADLYRDAVDR